MRCAEHFRAESERKVLRLNHQMFGQPEVSEVTVIIRIKEDVSRLHISVQHAALMGEAQSARDAGKEVGGLAPLSAEVTDACGQRATCRELHGEPGQAVTLTHIIHRQNGRMLQAGHGAGLAAEAFTRLLILRPLRAHHFQRHDALRLKLLRLIDDAHAAAGDLIAPLQTGQIITFTRRIKEAGRTHAFQPSCRQRRVAFRAEVTGGRVRHVS